LLFVNGLEPPLVQLLVAGLFVGIEKTVSSGTTRASALLGSPPRHAHVNLTNRTKRKIE